MKISQKNIIWLFIVAMLLSMPRQLYAERVYFFGKIGDFPIGGFLEQKEDLLHGWYFYTSRGKLIELTGKIDRNGSFRMEEEAHYKKSGSFEGGVKQGRWTGTWRKTGGGAPMQFSFEENHDLLKDIKGNYECSFKVPVPEGNYSVNYDLKIGIANGVLKKFKVVESARGKYVDNECYMELKDMLQVDSKTGILLKADEEDGGNEGMKCTVRIVGNKDILWIVFGASSEAGDDCRGSSDRMFCSTRGGWADIMIDRHTKKCRADY